MPVRKKKEKGEKEKQATGLIYKDRGVWNTYKNKLKQRSPGENKPPIDNSCNVCP